MNSGFVIGYDPGGNGAHGVAALKVREMSGRWTPIGLDVSEASTLYDAVEWLNDACREGRIVAAGVDTLTEWNSGWSGWRPADCWLVEHYPEVAPSVVAPNSVSGSMAVNGAAFLTLLAPRFHADDTMVTEAHPKVCAYALTGTKQVWAADRSAMMAWLVEELGIDPPDCDLGDEDHCFDAGIGALAALRGLNREWTLDLHALPGRNQVWYAGRTHYWWPTLGLGDKTTE